MFKNRATTFHERLRWNVKVVDGYEKDEFDEANPLYVVSAGSVFLHVEVENDQVVACQNGRFINNRIA